MKSNKTKKTNRINNHGAGMVTVIIAMAFVTVLGSIVMTVSLTNYRMKSNNLRAKDSFYTAEQALDEIRVGLQGLVSDAVSEAYLDVLEHYSSYDLEQKNNMMQSKYFQTLWNTLAENPSDPKKFKVSVLDSYLVETKWQNIDNPASPSNKGDGYGAIIAIADGKTNGMVAYKDTGIVLKNLEVYYRDKQGYVSIIRTDIKLAIPNLQFASNTALTDVSLYSLVADEKLVLGTSGTNRIDGNIYAGTVEVIGADPLNKANCKVEFGGNAQLVSKQKLDIQHATVLVAPNTEVWTKDISVDNSNLTLNGNCNVGNDLLMKGNGSVVTVKGNYNGYGCSLTDAEKSSAILINGNDTVLDVSASKMITLAGHAYIGTGKVDPAITQQNVLMGESIAVKGNQLIYLVPGECLGVKVKMEDGVMTYGNSKYGKNPLTATQYAEITSGEGGYVEIADNIIVDKLGNSLSAYLKYSGTTPKPEKIFIQTNGETLVYYYMSFDNEEKANKYFRDYYGINQERMDEYIDFYTNGITMADPKLMIRLQLAGNVAKYEETSKKSSLQENTLKDASVTLKTNSKNSTQAFDALCTRLTVNYNDLTDLKETDLSKDIVFDNIAEMEAINKFVTENGSLGSGFPKSYTFVNETDKAVITNNGHSGNISDYIFGASADSNIHLIIATGNVVIQKDFSGLILANGTVTVKEGVKVTPASEKVRNLLRSHVEIGGTTYNLIGFLRDGKEMLNAVGNFAGGNDASVQLSDLVIYENWSKN